MARRYEMHKDKAGKYAMYHGVYDRLKMSSQILSPSKIPGVYSINFSDREGIESCLLQWKGQEGKDGDYLSSDDNWYPSQQKVAKKQIEAIQEEFKQYKQIRVNEGKRPSKDMPAEMQEQMLEAEARLDLINEEIEFLEKKLSTFTTSDQKTLDGAVLKNGPQGSGKLRGGILVIVDGQTVAKDAKGVLRIADKRSPYNGLETYRYFDEVVNPWKHAMSSWQYTQTQQIRFAREAEKTGGDPGKFHVPPKPEWPKKPEETSKKILVT